MSFTLELSLLSVSFGERNLKQIYHSSRDVQFDLSIICIFMGWLTAMYFCTKRKDLCILCHDAGHL